MEKKKNNKKKYLALLLALFVCAGGTMAWLTSESSLTNIFKVGDITDIETPDNNPDGGKDPDGDKVDSDPTKLDGNLYEPDWQANSPLSPDATVKKNPYVGIGPDSEDSYAFIMVKTNMQKVTFDINDDNWVAVDVDSQELQNGQYTQGLFKYNKVLEGNTGNVWTESALFEEVHADKEAKIDDLKGGKIIVKAYVHQAKNGEGTYIENSAIQAAKDTYAKWQPDFN